MDGKSDWMAYGLPVEGTEGPFAGQQLSPLPTCGTDETVGAALARLGRGDGHADGGGDGDLVIVVHGDGLAVGAVDRELLASAGAGDRLLDVMSPVPSTVRPSVPAAALAEAAGETVVVTSSDGRLLGGFRAARAGDR